MLTIFTDIPERHNIEATEEIRWRIETRLLLRMNQTLNEDGMLLPGPSKSGQSSRDNNEETLLASDSDFESGQRSPERKHRHRKVRDMQDIIPFLSLLELSFLI